MSGERQDISLMVRHWEFGNKTPCEQLGYKVGDRFTIHPDAERGYANNYVSRAIIKLIDDDGTWCVRVQIGGDKLTRFFVYVYDLIPVSGGGDG